MPSPFQVVDFGNIAQGLNDSRVPVSVKMGQAGDLGNVRFEHGSIRKTLGRKLFNAQIVDGSTVAGAIYGLFDFVRKDGTRRFVVLADIDGTVKMFYDNSGTWTKVGDDDYKTSLASFAVMDNKLYVATDGVNINSVYDGTNQLIWGLPEPGDSPSVTSSGTSTKATLAVNAGGGALLAGDYTYRYTYYNSTSGEESNAADVSTALTVSANDQIDVTVEQDTWYNGTHFDQIKFYRSIADGTAHWLEETKSASSLDSGNLTFTLGDKTDGVIVAGGDNLETDNNRPVAHKYIIAHKNRIFGAGNATNPQQLTWSKRNNPGDWPLLNFINTFVPDTGGSQTITGLGVFQDMLYIFLRDSFFILRGSSEADFQMMRMPHGLGCVSHHTIRNFGNSLTWWSEAGPVSWNGSTIQELGVGRIDELMRKTSYGEKGGIEGGRMSSLHSALYKTAGRIEHRTLFTENTDTSTSQTKNNKSLDYDVKANAFSVTTLTASVYGIIEDSNDLDVLYAGTYDGKVLQIDTGDDFEGADIDGFWETGWESFGDRKMEKRFRRIYVWLGPSDLPSHKVTVSWYKDFETSPVDTKEIDVIATRGEPVIIPVSYRGYATKIRFQNTKKDEDFSIEGLSIGFRSLKDMTDSP